MDHVDHNQFSCAAACRVAVYFKRSEFGNWDLYTTLQPVERVIDIKFLSSDLSMFTRYFYPTRVLICL